MLPIMKTRYAVTPLADKPGWGILDRRLRAFCSLAGVPLEWSAQADAEVWLYRCRVAWRGDLVPVPAGWNG
jgi:hypothetical protein